MQVLRELHTGMFCVCVRVRVRVRVCVCERERDGIGGIAVVYGCAVGGSKCNQC